MRYEVALDLTQPMLECNCSHCQAKGLLLAFIPWSEFTLLSGEDALTEYRFNQKTIAHQFCSTCGVQPFAQATGKDGTPMAAVNVRTIDGIDVAGLTHAPFSGRDI